jgi:pimeloyl-ACP methyl ester carboxylesterase
MFGVKPVTVADVDGNLADFLLPPGFLGPRGIRALSRETSTVFETLRLVHHVRVTRTARRSTRHAAHPGKGRTHPVVLVPGFLAGDVSLTALAAHLRGEGYRTYRSGIRLNARCVVETGDALERRVEDVADRRGQRVVLVGHSLGGMLSRNLAGRRPDLVAGLVTLGSPVLAPAAVHTLLRLDIALLHRLQRLGLRGLMGTDCTTGACAQQSWEQASVALPRHLPYTAVYSERDGIVDWRACLDPGAEHVRVSSSHCGMALDPRVFDVVTTALHQVDASARKRRLRDTPLPRSSAG